MHGVQNDGPQIRLEAVRKVYGIGGTPVTAISEASLEIRKGELVSLLGPSGCGKTIPLRIIAGLEVPTQGRVEVRGVGVWNDGKRQLAATRPISMMFQETRLFPWFSVVENVALPLRISGVGRTERLERARSACATVGLAGFEDAPPAALPGGMRQRASLARALAHFIDGCHPSSASRRR